MKKIFLIIFIYFIMTLTACSNKSEIDFGKDEISSEAIEKTVEITSENILIQETTADYITVFISGCVNKPDVYTLKEGSIVKDALDMAGGFSEEACKDYVNLAKKLEDGEHVIIPDKEAVDTGSFYVLESEKKQGDSLTNINTATKEELMSLPGIGVRKAEAIIEYRNTTRFLAIEDIMNISGIKEAAFNKIKDKICIN